MADYVTKHSQVVLDGVEVDAGLAGLLSRLWDLGFQTTFSCEGSFTKFAYLAFVPGTRLDEVEQALGLKLKQVRAFTVSKLLSFSRFWFAVNNFGSGFFRVLSAMLRYIRPNSVD